jgi:hypothetical protein
MFQDEEYFAVNMGLEAGCPKPTFDSLYTGVGEKLRLKVT